MKGNDRIGGRVKNDPVDGRHPANPLRLVAYLIIYRVLYIPNGAGFLNHQHFYYPPG